VKLLFDQNISFKVVRQLQDIYPESSHVLRLGLNNSSDLKIWEYAKKNGYTIVTFDADFNDLSILFKHPPKLIWLRFGNTITRNLVPFFIENKTQILEFVLNEENNELSCLEFN
jgi:predicted nuclease of predicted toxin-antitoxin system